VHAWAPELRTPLALGAGSLALAGLTLLAPSAPTTDAWGWIVWGRELVQLDLDTVVGGAPSWKPLPVLLTAPLSLTGDAAPTLWMLLARAGGVLSLICAYRLGSRLAGPWAGALAACALVLSSGFVRGFAHGFAEPLAVALLLAAVERHLAGRRGQALLLGAAVGLARPEAWPLLALYGADSWRRGRLGLWPVAALVVAVPALWIVPDWIGSGDPLHGSAVARSVLARTSGIAIEQAALFVPLPFTVLAVAGAVVAWRRGERAVTWLTALAFGWATLIALAMIAGYPASGRYFVLPASLVAVAGGVGAVLCVRPAGERPARLAVAAALAAATVPFVADRAADVVGDADAAVRRARLSSDLRAAAERAGEGRHCRQAAVPQGLAWVKGAVAWELDLPLRRVRELPTSARPFVRMLAEPRDGRPPRRPAARAVDVRAPAARLVLFEPFGGVPVRMRAGGGGDLRVVARTRRWGVMAPVRGCRRARGARVS
jgi:hypothetical protein